MSGNPIKKTSGHKEEDWHRLVRAEVRAGWFQALYPTSFGRQKME